MWKLDNNEKQCVLKYLVKSCSKEDCVLPKPYFVEQTQNIVSLWLTLNNYNKIT